MTDIVRKAIATIGPAPDEGTSPHGAFSVVLSTEAVDREGESVKASEWAQPLPARITMDVDHGMSVATTAGSGVPSIDDEGRLVVNGTYASTPLGQETRTLVNEGHIAAVSVAFMRREHLDAKGATVVSRELINGAFVAVPMNPEAMVVGSKSAASRRAESVQAVHDHALALGAVCGAAPKSLPPSDTDTAAAAALEAATAAQVDAARERIHILSKGITP